MQVRQTWLAIAIIALCLIAIPVSLIGASKNGMPSEEFTEQEEPWMDYFGGDHIAVIRLSGLIIDDDDVTSIWSGGENARAVLKQLRKTVTDNHVKGVLFRIDSPGGTVSTSQEIADEIKSLREKQKPVVVSMSDVSASGGYYIACDADKIVADPGTITGSIGVIITGLNLKGLGDKLGLKSQVIKSGPFKDIGSPYREMTPEDKSILQGLVTDAYDQFVSAVAAGRHMPLAAVRKLADGRIYSGRQASKLGLVDKLGSYTVAINTIQELCKERYHRTENLPVKEIKHKGLVSMVLEEMLAPIDLHFMRSLTPAFNRLTVGDTLSEFVKARYDHQPLWLMP